MYIFLRLLSFGLPLEPAFDDATMAVQKLFKLGLEPPVGMLMRFGDLDRFMRKAPGAYMEGIVACAGSAAVPDADLAAGLAADIAKMSFEDSS